MVFRRRKREPEATGSNDVFKQSVAERRATEDERPWFLEADDGAALDIEAGISSNLKDGELEG